MKRKMIQHRTDAGLYYATFERRRRRGFNWDGVIDSCVTLLIWWVVLMLAANLLVKVIA